MRANIYRFMFYFIFMCISWILACDWSKARQIADLRLPSLRPFLLESSQTEQPDSQPTNIDTNNTSTERARKQSEEGSLALSAWPQAFEVARAAV